MSPAHTHLHTHIHTLYSHGIPNAHQEHVAAAQSWAGLTLELDGALGVRTRFQTTPVAQLVLTARTQRAAGAAVLPPPCLPRDLQLDDDTVLEHPSFSVPRDSEVGTPLRAHAETAVNPAFLSIIRPVPLGSHCVRPGHHSCPLPRSEEHQSQARVSPVHSSSS